MNLDEILNKLKEHEGKSICIIKRGFYSTNMFEDKKKISKYSMKDVENLIPKEDDIENCFCETWMFRSTYIDITGNDFYWNIIIAADDATLDCLL